LEGNWGIAQSFGICWGVLLAIDSDWLVDSPHVVDELLVIGVVWVELGELVALPV